MMCHTVGMWLCSKLRASVRSSGTLIFHLSNTKSYTFTTLLSTLFVTLAKVYQKVKEKCSESEANCCKSYCGNMAVLKTSCQCKVWDTRATLEPWSKIHCPTLPLRFYYAFLLTFPTLLLHFYYTFTTL